MAMAICTDCAMWVANGDTTGMSPSVEFHVTNPAHDDVGDGGYWVVLGAPSPAPTGHCDRCGVETEGRYGDIYRDTVAATVVFP